MPLPQQTARWAFPTIELTVVEEGFWPDYFEAEALVDGTVLQGITERKHRSTAHHRYAPGGRSQVDLSVEHGSVALQRLCDVGCVRQHRRSSSMPICQPRCILFDRRMRHSHWLGLAGCSPPD